MNRINKENYNNKYDLDPKWVKCAGCSKPATLRRGEGNVVSAFRGRNNEELCHKCACCYHCGKKEKWDVYRKVGYQWEVEEDYGMPSYHLVDDDNPSGGWDVAFCLDCGDKKGHETFRYYDDREYWKVDGTMFNPEAKREWNNFENFKRAYERAQDYWNSLSSSEREQEGERVVENMKLGKYLGGLRGKEGEMFGWVPNNSWWRVENGKLVSSEPQLVPTLIAEEFMKKMFGDINLCKELVLRDYKIVKKDNNGDKDHSPSPNPATPTPQSTTDLFKTIKFENKENESENNPPDLGGKLADKEVDNQTLTIELKRVEKITLNPSGHLVITFDNKQENHHCYLPQTITPDQINNSSELRRIRDYCQKSGRTSLSQQELSSVISTTSPVPNTNSNDNNGLGIGLAIAGALIVGLATGLFLSRKRKIKKN